MEGVLEFADLLDDDAARLGFGLDAVAVGVLQRAVGAEQVRGEAGGEGELARARRAGDEVGVREAVLRVGDGEEMKGGVGGEGHR